jgi:hypothetical protein
VRRVRVRGPAVSAFYTVCAGGPGDPARVAGRPGGQQSRPGRPGTGGRSTRRPTEPHRVNRAPVPVDPPHPAGGKKDASKDVVFFV